MTIITMYLLGYGVSIIQYRAEAENKLATSQGYWINRTCINGVLYYDSAKFLAPAYDHKTKEVILCQN